MDLPSDPETPLLGIYLKGPKTLIERTKAPLCSLQRYLRSPRQRGTKVSVSRWVGKTTMGHLHNGILLGHKKDEKWDGPGEYYAKWNKPVRERQTPYDFTHMWILMNKLELTRKMGSDLQMGSRLTAGGGRWGGGGMEQKGKGLMDMDNSVVIAGGTVILGD